MPQRYKLRLGDGTVLSVDSDGLKTWAQDARATVQMVGSWRWQSLQEVLAEEAAAARLAQALVPPTPRATPSTALPEPPATPAPHAAAPPPPTPASRATPSPVSPPRAAPPQPVSPPPEQPPPLELPDFGTPPAASRPGLQVLADDPVSALDALVTPAEEEDVPVIPLKPLAEEPEFQSAWSGGDEAADEEDHDLELRRGRLDGPLLTTLETLGGFLSRTLRPLLPLANRLTAKRPRSRAPQLEMQVEPFEEPATEAPSLRARATGWLGALRARVRRTKGEEREQALAPPSPPMAAPVAAPARSAQPLTSPATPRSATIVPAEPIQAPPLPVSQLKSLPLKPTHEPREAPIVYEDDEPSVVWPLVWGWTKRALILGVLAAGAAYAYRERDRWFQRAGEAGQALFAQVDRLVFSRQRAETERKALEQASAQLPQLRPETIRLVFSRFPAGVAEASEVFEVTWDAADRGRGALEAAEAEELAGLQRELVAALSRTERSRVQEYDRTRARRPIFPFENPRVMELVAKGARALPPERRERLQALLHKTVVAVLEPPAGAVTPTDVR